MTNILQRKCETCKREFAPKARGFNAKYCSTRCKVAAGYHRWTPAKRRKLRRRSWTSTKASPARLLAHNKRSNNSARAIRVWLAEYKLSIGCVDCGYDKFACALQFDHEGPKTFAISEIRTSKARILEEIAKGNCKVRCANCHAVKTWQRKQVK